MLFRYILFLTITLPLSPVFSCAYNFFWLSLLWFCRDIFFLIINILLVYLFGIFISLRSLYKIYRSYVLIILIYLILHDCIMCTTLFFMNFIILHWKWIACANIINFYLSIILLMPRIILYVGCQFLNYMPTLIRATSCYTLSTILPLYSCPSSCLWAFSSW